MTTAMELFNKGEDLWVKSFQVDGTEKRSHLLKAVSFIQQAVSAGPSNPYMLAILSRVLHALGEIEGRLDLIQKAIEHANAAIKLNVNSFDAYYTLYMIALEEFDQKGGFNAKAKTKVNWGMMAIGALLAPEAAGSVIGSHFGKKVTDKAFSREAGQRLYTAFAGMVSSFAWAAQNSSHPGTVEYYARVILMNAADMEAAAYPMKQVYQTIVASLSQGSNYGQFEDQIRDLEAQARGALMLL